VGEIDKRAGEGVKMEKVERGRKRGSIAWHLFGFHFGIAASKAAMAMRWQLSDILSACKHSSPSPSPLHSPFRFHPSTES